MRFKSATRTTRRTSTSPSGLERSRREVESRLKIGASMDWVDGESAYAYRAESGTRASSRCRRLRREHPGLRGAPGPLEIVKDLGDANTVAGQYKLDTFRGTHAIGHVRMATESDVDIAGRTSYWAYLLSDVAVVHNGQLTNYQWRRRLGALRSNAPVRV
ncbi:hypothetical protein HBB16_08990 [Pseudonocardia sp. MCCB 268]|nr:hypothetical protein [Pseudonocardia cytotoxica]